jgi:hypothetical protein
MESDGGVGEVEELDAALITRTGNNLLVATGFSQR